jgi:UDPglucose 6-dehydrogenase
MAMNLSLVGLGKLGLCLASSLAEKGFRTIGVDLEEEVVKSVNAGKAPWFEPGLDELLEKHGGKRFSATTDHSEAIEKSDATFVLVATPSNPDGSFSNRFVDSALKSLAEALGNSLKAHHLFIISCTVMPGSTDSSFIPALEKYSGRKLHEGFEVCYVPDFVALGNVVKGFLNPDLVVIGETSPPAGEAVEAIYRQLCENKPAISRMSIINAELAKVCLNAYITVKISFANSIANLCETIPGADVDAITRAIGPDRRISPHYFQGGLSFGGTCFPRDVRAYLSLSEKYQAQADILRAVDHVNKYQDRRLVEVVLDEIESLQNPTVGILGLAFTPHTAVITESPAVKLVEELVRRDLRVVANDPLALENAKARFGSAVQYSQTPEACLAQAGLCVVTLRTPALKKAVENYNADRPITVVDCWRVLDPCKLGTQIKYVPLGRSR